MKSLNANWRKILDLDLLKEALAKDKALREDPDEPRTLVPDKKNVVRIFKETDPENIRVVMVFQDPYPKTHACGRAVATEKDKIPYSLHMLQTSHKKEFGDLTLQHWQDQGVLLLNRALSTIEGEPGALFSVWEPFAQDLAQKLNSHLSPGTVFVFFGVPAQKLSKHIDEDKHIVLLSAHPAAERYKPGIFSNRDILSEVNQKLIENNQNPIKWQSTEVPDKDLLSQPSV